MLYLYVIPAFIAGIITLSWYYPYGFNFFYGNPRGNGDDFLLKTSIPKPKHNVPVYMWDIYKNGINRNGNSAADIVRGVHPKFLGPSFSSQHYPNHRTEEIEFSIPEIVDGETLVHAEICVMTDVIRLQNVSFQIFHKDVTWVFLDARTVPADGVGWISLTVTPSVKTFKKPSAISFLLLTVFRGLNKRTKALKDLKPFLLLSYTSQRRALVRNHSASYFPEMKAKPLNIRRKRSLSQHYGEETNLIWEGGAVVQKQQRIGNTCKRKPLYIEFSEIDYDTWIVAPTGYEAFQCVGKCMFPVAEHLSPTKHAIVQTLMHHVSPTKVGRACCVPTRLDPISVLYVNSNGILTYRLHYHGMVVAECGCR